MSIDTEGDLNGCNEQEHWPRSNGVSSARIIQSHSNLKLVVVRIVGAVHWRLEEIHPLETLICYISFP